MKALILAADGFEDSELLYPYYRFKEERIDVTVATPEGNCISGKHGYCVEADADLAKVSADDFDLLVIPGGKAPEIIRLNTNAVKVTREMVEAGKLVAAICHGGQVLISAGVLKGRKATCYEAIADDLKAAGADYSDQEVVVDGKLITSRCPADLPAFSRSILDVLKM